MSFEPEDPPLSVHSRHMFDVILCHHSVDGTLFIVFKHITQLRQCATNRSISS